ncbi:MAG: hypothetical protein OXF79_22445 [Chloroflexi bacterium]|nr:hypothetical protein [Chloroflexota bacterium]
MTTPAPEPTGETHLARLQEMIEVQESLPWEDSDVDRHDRSMSLGLLHGLAGLQMILGELCDALVALDPDEEE